MKHLILIATIVALAGCAAQPYSGTIYQPVIDFSRSGTANLPTDIRDCNALASQRMNGAQAAVAGAVVGALLGAALSAAAGGHGSLNGQMAGFGAITGGVSAGSSAEVNQRVIVARCMAERGYTVLGL